MMDPPALVACGVVPLRRSALSGLACVSIALAMPVLTPNPAAAAELSPAAVAEMFLKALELQGRNPRVIRSGDISYEERITRAQETRERHEENARQHISALERRVKEATNDIERERWKNEIEALRKEAEAGPPQQTPTDWTARDVFVGNNPRKRSRDEAALKEPSNGLKSEQIRLCESDGSERAFLSRFPEARDTSLHRNAFSVSSTEYCGRARGPMALAITTFLLSKGGSHDEFTFSPAATESPQEAFKAVGSTWGWGGGQVPRLVATGTFEGSEVFEIEFGMGDRWSSNAPPRKILRLSIDPGRGHIVPVEEEYQDGKRVLRLESSDYRQSGTDGLWFPWQSKETHYDPATGAVVSEHEWRVAAAVFNEAVDPKEFEVVIPPGEAIADFRGNSSVGTPYRTQRQITLGANVPHRDLTSIPGVIKPEVLGERHLPAASAWSWGRWLSLAATGGLLVALIGIAVGKRRWN
jgi:hypothetical protein